VSGPTTEQQSWWITVDDLVTHSDPTSHDGVEDPRIGIEDLGHPGPDFAASVRHKWRQPIGGGEILDEFTARELPELSPTTRDFGDLPTCAV